MRADHDEEHVWKPDEELGVEFGIGAQGVGHNDEEKIKNTDDEAGGEDGLVSGNLLEACVEHASDEGGMLRDAHGEALQGDKSRQSGRIG